MSGTGKCERHQVWTWQMVWADANNEPAPQLCPLCLAADLADLKELTNRRIAPILEQIEKFRVELSELGLRTDNHNASRKAEIGYLRADVDRIDRINTGVLESPQKRAERATSEPEALTHARMRKGAVPPPPEALEALAKLGFAMGGPGARAATHRGQAGVAGCRLAWGCEVRVTNSVIPDATVDQVIELLLCGWTPQNVVEGWPEVKINHSHDGYGCPSLVSVQRIARAEGLARQRGAQPGRSRPAGSGRKATGFGTGTKHRTHAKWSPHRARASELRAEGLSFNVIAGILGITRQGVQKILSDEI